MPNKILVVAPHPDDEVLGAGGTLLRRKAEGATVAWLIVAGVSVAYGWGQDKVAQRGVEVEKISSLFGFDAVFELNFPTTELDRIPMRELVAAISKVIIAFEPDELFIPHWADVHTDHRIVFDAAVCCTKWFRYPSVRRVLAYETLSETGFGLNANQSFHPNVFVNIEPYLDIKLRAMDIYASEIGDFPFPRSHEAIRALAMIRGAASGFREAEAFELLLERI
jgi:LmbE family N-acetylglucosaminyl deacetylase